MHVMGHIMGQPIAVTKGQKTAGTEGTDQKRPIRMVLGIETSCDETAAAVVSRAPTGKGIILSNIIHSQITEHAEFGGVVPEIAARSHLSRLDGIIKAALDEADCTFDDLDGVAVTAGPGLVGGLLTGVMTAKAICAARNLPFFAVNHLEGHALTARLTDGLDFPYLLLLVSGGHTQFVDVRGVGDYHRLSTTIDDALGEAFDKTAKLLSLGHPGGPLVEKAAVKGDPKRFEFPRPLSGKAEVNFSFSGLKTAIRQTANRLAPLNDQDVADICASFQAAIIDVLSDRTRKMIARFRDSPSAKWSPVGRCRRRGGEQGYPPGVGGMHRLRRMAVGGAAACPVYGQWRDDRLGRPGASCPA